eukprot:CAMPEP_0116822440 /NCGR_PEP_ID=MMETSP0418-20121206/269_1 /TAXON_ID=1158023 /ORGANISM="Astrosyne radiata, Strain 13vi08-1A" /LENGTH=195 /DNA_ID=CAMNT_0004450553 /DNA_START=33 /DNA_END=620 /DNA_ORIENTATION=+
MGKGGVDPDWANPGTTGGATESAGVPASSPVAADSPTTGGGGAGKGRDSWVLAGLSILDICLAGLMATLGVLTILTFRSFSPSDFSEGFLAGYMIIFACLLFAYEMMWWSGVPSVNKVLRKNFGFLYGIKGKGLYLIFVAFLCLGLGNDKSVQTLTYVTGVAFLVVGILHIVVALFHPDVSMQYQAPTAGLENIV